LTLRLRFRLVSEDFLGFDWDEPNRDAHFRKHGIDFPIVARLDWTRTQKAMDTREGHSPPRSIALVQEPTTRRVLVVVYAKRDRIGRIISVRLANAAETALFHAG